LNVIAENKLRAHRNHLTTSLYEILTIVEVLDLDHGYRFLLRCDF
jgi:hypothetical protein